MSKHDPIPSLTDTTRWFSEHESEYVHKWVAVRAGVLLGYNDNRKALLAELGDKIDRETVVTYIIDYSKYMADR